MRKIFLIALVLLLVSLLIYFIQKGQSSTVYQIPQIQQTTPSPSKEIAEEEPEEINITASFEIYTNTTKRIFTASMYHNLSEDVYINADDPSLVHVKKAGITWSNFFATLPMKLTKDCLETGTKQTFCSGQDGALRFFINDQENPNALDEIIKQGDFLKVTYGGI